jgi:hypothetical protein
MAFVPRTLDEILTSLRNTRGDVDPYADSTKGPMSVLLYCYATGLSRVEQHAAYLSSLYQLEIADAQASDDLNNLGRNYGKNPNVGTPSRVNLTFWKQSRPQAGKLYNIDAGTLASTDDGRYVFSTLRTVIMVGDSADLYYNATTMRYEISVMAEATAVGDDYNIPAGTISSIIGTLMDFDGVINSQQASNGSDPLTPMQFRNIIWDAMQGLNANIAGNFINVIESIQPAGFDDMRMVPSTNLDVFKRSKLLNGKLGYDIYVLSDLFLDDIYTGVAQGGETEIILPLRPVMSAVYCTVDGVSVPFTFHQDMTSVYAGSPMSSDKIILAAPMLPAQVFEVRYYYYSLIHDAWTAMQGRNSPFKTDVLVRRPNPVPIFIAASISSSGVTDRDSIVRSVKQMTEAYLRNPRSPSSARRVFDSLYDPYEYQNVILSSVNGISNFSLLNFFRMDRAYMDIETITLDGLTEYPILSPSSSFTV